MVPSKLQRDEWRRLAAETQMISAVGEYTPSEFTELLDAVDELETACEAAYRRISGDHTDGGEILDDRSVIRMLLKVLGRAD